MRDGCGGLGCCTFKSGHDHGGRRRQLRVGSSIQSAVILDISTHLSFVDCILNQNAGVMLHLS